MRLTRHVHARRLSGVMIILLVSVATAIAGGAGVLLATVTAAEPPAPTAAVNVGQAAATPFPDTGSVTTSFGSLPLPSGFTVADQSSDRVVLTGDGGRERIVVSQVGEPDAIDTGVLTQDLINGDRRRLDGNTQICADDGTDTATLTLTGGRATGVYLPLCVSVVPQNAPAFTARDYYYAGLGQRDGRPVALVVEVFGPTGSFPGLAAKLGGYVPAIHWAASPLP